MKSNKGFTLIELLAVIVILAIVALVATPVILNIINDATEKAKKSDANLLVNSVSLAYTNASYTKNGARPTIAEVKSAFEDIMDNAKWDDTTDNTKITLESDNHIKCSVTVPTTYDSKNEAELEFVCENPYSEYKSKKLIVAKP